MQNNKPELYGLIKNMTLAEFASIFNDNDKKNERESKENYVLEKNDKKTLYTINELIENYPFFTRYNINKAIQKNALPYCVIGNKRMFSKEEIDKWLDKETSQKKEKYKI